MPPSPHVLVAMSNFKGTLTNIESCLAVSKALKLKRIPHKVIPVGDGGQGTLNSIKNCLNGEIKSFKVSGPFTKKVAAQVFCIPNRISPSEVYIECRDTCGTFYHKSKHKNAMRASSRGLGELIRLTVRKWPHLKKIYVGLGDTVVSDAGIGMLSKLGFVFKDQRGNIVTGDARGLVKIHSVELPKRLNKFPKLIALCDVRNPLLGKRGSAPVFSPQKGATKKEVIQIELGMKNYARLIKHKTRRLVANRPLTGVAGGISASLYSFLNAKLVQGASFLFDLIHLNHEIGKANFVITGEGKTDRQTTYGKAIWEIIKRCQKKNINTIVLSGKVIDTKSFNSFSHISIYECGKKPTPKKALFQKTLKILNQMGL